MRLDGLDLSLVELLAPQRVRMALDAMKLAELVKHPFLTLASHTNVRSILDRAFEDLGHAVDPKYVFCHHYTLGGMVEAGLGITALPSMSLSILGHPRLMSARIVEPQVTRVIGVLRRHNDVLSPAATAFLATVWEVFRKVSRGRKHVTMSAPAPSSNPMRESASDS